MKYIQYHKDQLIANSALKDKNRYFTLSLALPMLK